MLATWDGNLKEPEFGDELMESPAVCNGIRYIPVSAVSVNMNRFKDVPVMFASGDLADHCVSLEAFAELTREKPIIIKSGTDLASADLNQARCCFAV